MFFVILRQWGPRGVECVTQPEGVIGRATLADLKKAYKSLEGFLDYVVKLHNDILAKFPPDMLPRFRPKTIALVGQTGVQPRFLLQS